MSNSTYSLKNSPNYPRIGKNVNTLLQNHYAKLTLFKKFITFVAYIALLGAYQMQTIVTSNINLSL